MAICHSCIVRPGKGVPQVPLFLGLSRLRLSDSYVSLVMTVVANAFQRYFAQGITLTGTKG